MVIMITRFWLRQITLAVIRTEGENKGKTDRWIDKLTTRLTDVPIYRLIGR